MPHGKTLKLREIKPQSFIVVVQSRKLTSAEKLASAGKQIRNFNFAQRYDKTWYRPNHNYRGSRRNSARIERRTLDRGWRRRSTISSVCASGR